jgi:hypothetical protein
MHKEDERKDYETKSQALADFLYAGGATVSFLAAHFRVAVDPEYMFWVGIMFNVFLFANIGKRL